jgi:hypothetical protein
MGWGAIGRRRILTHTKLNQIICYYCITKYGSILEQFNDDSACI